MYIHVFTVHNTLNVCLFNNDNNCMQNLHWIHLVIWRETGTGRVFQTVTLLHHVCILSSTNE